MRKLLNRWAMRRVIRILKGLAKGNGYAHLHVTEMAEFLNYKLFYVHHYNTDTFAVVEDREEERFLHKVEMEVE